MMYIPEIINAIATHLLPTGGAFLGVYLILVVLGHFSSSRVFTRERAYGQNWRLFWYWGRETLPCHPILAGGLLGCGWRDPFGVRLSLPMSVTYFAAAGACAMVTWVLIKGYGKKRGLTIELPGESEPPPADTDDVVTVVEKRRPTTGSV